RPASAPTGACRARVGRAGSSAWWSHPAPPARVRRVGRALVRPGGAPPGAGGPSWPGELHFELAVRDACAGRTTTLQVRWERQRAAERADGGPHGGAGG